MPIRRQTTFALTLTLMGAACATPFSNTGGAPDVISLQPRVARSGATRREGSDVTIPNSAGRGRVIGALIPCDARDSIQVKPRIVPECEGIDPKGDIDRPATDTTTQRRP